MNINYPIVYLKHTIIFFIKLWLVYKFPIANESQYYSCFTFYISAIFVKSVCSFFLRTILQKMNHKKSSKDLKKITNSC